MKDIRRIVLVTLILMMGSAALAQRSTDALPPEMAPHVLTSDEVKESRPHGVLLSRPEGARATA